MSLESSSGETDFACSKLGATVHLYVMQNEHGFLKIGRSVRVEQRRRALEKTEGCSIATVMVVENAGEHEEFVHIEMDDHRVIGEWFRGTQEARDRLLAMLEWAQPVTWPYEFEECDATERWLEMLEMRRRGRSTRRELGRLALEMMRHPVDPADDDVRRYDTCIWTALNRFESGCPTFVDAVRGRDESLILTGHRPDNTEGEPLPHYTRDLEAALTLWPHGSRPDRWNGSAYECCVAALLARKTIA